MSKNRKNLTFTKNLNKVKQLQGRIFKASVGLTSVLSTAMTGMQATAGTLPTGGDVKAGDAAIRHVDANRMVIDQSSQQAVIDWNTFNVGKSDSVHFNQPSVSSSTLNRVLSSTPSTIAGTVSGTGQVFLVNPNGILITESGVIDTNSFTASSLNIRNGDFMNGKFEFTKDVNANGMVENRGEITVNDGGFAALVGEAIKNDGVINAHLGKVAFGAGEKVVLTMGDSALLQVVVSSKDLAKLRDSAGNKVTHVIDHSGSITADGGMVQITAKSAGDLLRQNVRISGDIYARTVKEVGGQIIIGGADSLTTESTAKLDVSGSVLGDALAELKSNGGTINIQGVNEIALAGRFLADGMNDGGKITVVAGAKGLTSTATFSADGENGNGGRIGITADGGDVRVISGDISATGQDRGGLIRVGGEFQGGAFNAQTSSLNDHQQDSFVKRWGKMVTLGSALNTTVSRKVLINASASTGSGGTVVLWSDKHTEQQARITANGGSRGGSVEISGKDTLDFDLHQLDLKNGELLLDPKNLVIGSTTAAENAAGLEQRRASGIASTLSGGTNVTAAASSNVTVQNTINAEYGTGKLTLQAGRNITINAAVKVGGGIAIIGNSSDFSHGDMDATKRDTGVAKIKINHRLKASDTADITITMEDGASGATDNKRYSGDITIGSGYSIEAGRISIVHKGTKFQSGDANSRSHIKLSGELDARKGSGNSAGDNELTLELVADSLDYDSSKVELLSTTAATTKVRALIWVKSVNDFNPKNAGAIFGGTSSGSVGFGYSHSGTAFDTTGPFTTSAILFKEGFQTRTFKTSASKTKVYDGTSTMSTTGLPAANTLRLNNTALTGTSNAFVNVGGGLRIKDNGGAGLSGADNDGKTLALKVDNGPTGGQYVNGSGTADADAGAKAQFTGAKISLGYLGKTVKVKNFDLTNITLTSTDANAKITPKPVRVTLTAASTSKTYNAQTELAYTGAVTFNTADLVAGHSLNNDGTKDYKIITGSADADTYTTTSGTAGKKLTFHKSGSTIGTGTAAVGTHAFKASNYKIGTITAQKADGTALTSFTINPKVLTASGTVENRQYDGTDKFKTFDTTGDTTDGKADGIKWAGFVNSEYPNWTGTFQAKTTTAGQKDVANGIAISPDASGITLADDTGAGGSGFKKDNYAFNTGSGFTLSSGTAAITQKTLKVKLTTKTRAYDGSQKLDYETLTLGDFTGLATGTDGSTKENPGTSTGKFAANLDSKDVKYNSAGDTVIAQGVTYGVGDWWSKLNLTGTNGFKKSNYKMVNADVTGKGSTGTGNKEKITPATLTAKITAKNKVYDGTDKLTYNTLTNTNTDWGGLVSGEKVVISSGSFTVTTAGNRKDVTTGAGVGYTASKTGLTLGDSTDAANKFKAGNYVLANPTLKNTGHKVKITPKPIRVTLTATPTSKTYNGKKVLDYTGAVTFNTADLVAGHSLNNDGTSDYKITTESADAGTYTPGSTSGKKLTFVAGSTATIGTGTATGGVHAFKASNYKIGTITAKKTDGNPVTSFTINKASLKVKLTTQSRGYDGKKKLNYNTLTLTDFTGLATGTDGSTKESPIGKSTGKFKAELNSADVKRKGDGSVDEQNVTYGIGDWWSKLANTGDNGFKKANYAIMTDADVTGKGSTGNANKEKITPRTLTAKIKAQDKVYDGTDKLTYDTLTNTNTDWDGLATGEKVVISGGSFTVTTAGNRKDVTTGAGVGYTASKTGLTLGDSTDLAANKFKAGNYVLANPTLKTTGHKVKITPRPIGVTLNATPISKTYDGQTVLTYTGSVTFDTADLVSGHSLNNDGTSDYEITTESADVGTYTTTDTSGKKLTFAAGSTASIGTGTATGGAHAFKASNYKIGTITAKNGGTAVTSFAIEKASLKVKLTTKTRAYDGTKNLEYETLTLGDFTGLAIGDDGSTKESPVGKSTGKFKAESSSADVGTYGSVTYGVGDWWSKLAATGDNGFKKSNYKMATTNPVTGKGSTGIANTEIITKADLRAKITATDKQYDGTDTLDYTIASMTTADWEGLVSGETVVHRTGIITPGIANKFNITATAGADAGDNKAITYAKGGYTLGTGTGGNKFRGSNYNLLAPVAKTAGDTVNISKRKLSVTLTNAPTSKTYDGKKVLDYTGAVTFGNVVPGHTITAGTKDYKINTESADAGLYTTTDTSGKKLTFGAGTSTFTGTGTTTAGSHAFDANNYEIGTITAKTAAGAAVTSFSIGAKVLTVTLKTKSKVYDGNGNLDYNAITFANFSGLKTGTDGSTKEKPGTSTGTFTAVADSADAGTQTVTYGPGDWWSKLPTMGTNGFKKANYQLSVQGVGSTGATGKEKITPKSLSVRLKTKSRAYNGLQTLEYENLTVADFTGLVSGEVPGNLNTSGGISSGAGKFQAELRDNANAGLDKRVFYALGNYTLSDGASGNAFKASNYKIDTVTGRGSTGRTGKQTITKATLKAKVTAENKVYDGNKKLKYGNYADVVWENLADGEVVPNWDKFLIQADNKNVGNNKTISYNTGTFTLQNGGSGFKKNNYTWGGVSAKNTADRVNITKATLDIKLTTQSRAYDGSKKLSYDNLTRADFTGLAPGETPGGLSTSGGKSEDSGKLKAELRDNADAGVDKFVVYGKGSYALSNTGGTNFDKANYQIGTVTGQDSAGKVNRETIARAVLTAKATAKNKDYDGTTDLSFDTSGDTSDGKQDGVTWTGLVSGEKPAYTGTFKATSASKDVANGINISPDASRVSLRNHTTSKFKTSNYSFNKAADFTLTNTNIDIGKKTLKVALVTKTREYDGGKVLTYQTPTFTGLATGTSGTSKEVPVSTGTFKAQLATKDVKYGSGAAANTVIAQSVTYGVGDWFSKLSAHGNNGFKAGNYQMVDADVTGVGSTGNANEEKITPATLSAKVTAENRAYDGTKKLTYGNYADVDWTNLAGSEKVPNWNKFLVQADDKDANTGIGVTYNKGGFTLADDTTSGFIAKNYQWGTVTGKTAGATVDITPKALQVKLKTKARAYDGTTKLEYETLTAANFTGLAPKGTDDTNPELPGSLTGGVSEASGKFKAVTDNKDVKYAGNTVVERDVTYGVGDWWASLPDNGSNGFKKSNYSISNAGVTGKGSSNNASKEKINRRVIVVNGLTVATTKVYDGNKNIGYSNITWNNALSTETPATSGALEVTTANADVGDNKAVSVAVGSLKLVDGADGKFKRANYFSSVGPVGSVTVGSITGKKTNITPKTLTVKLTTKTRAYNGNKKLEYNTLTAANFTGLVVNGDGSKQTPGGLTGGVSEATGKFKAELASKDVAYDGAGAVTEQSVTFGVGEWWNDLPNTGTNSFKKSNYQISDSGVSGTGSTGKAGQEKITQKWLDLAVDVKGGAAGKAYDRSKLLAYVDPVTDVDGDISGLVGAEKPSSSSGTLKFEAYSADVGTYTYAATAAAGKYTRSLNDYALQDNAGTGFTASNYKLRFASSDPGKINKKTLKVHLTTKSRPYNASKKLEYKTLTAADFTGLIAKGADNTNPELPANLTGGLSEASKKFKAQVDNADVGYTGSTATPQSVSYGLGDWWTSLPTTGSNGFKKSNYTMSNADVTGESEAGVASKEIITRRITNIGLTTLSRPYDGTRDLTYANLKRTDFSNLVTGQTPGGLASSGGKSMESGKFKAELRVDADAAVDKDVTYHKGNYSLADGDSGNAFKANNYQMGTVTGVGSAGKASKETITPASLTAKVTPVDKIYDGDADIAYSGLTWTGFIGSENPAKTGDFKLTAASKDVAYTTGATPTVTTQGVTVDKNDMVLADATDGSGFKASNYKFDGVSLSKNTVEIDQRSLVATLTSKSRGYTAGKQLPYTVAWSGMAPSERPGPGTGLFKAELDSAGVGTNKKVNYGMGNYKLSDGPGGFVAKNYKIIRVTGNGQVNVGKLNIYAKVTASNKVYDGNTVLTYSNLQWVGLPSGENAGYAGTFNITSASKDVGTHQVSYSNGNFTLKDSGAFKAANYNFMGVSANVPDAKVTITPKTLNVSLTSLGKVYDGTTPLQYSNPTFSGLVDGETPGAGIGAFNVNVDDVNAGDQNVIYEKGTYKLSNNLTSGFKASNYALGTVTGTNAKAKITPRPLTVSLKTQSRAYDGEKKLSYDNLTRNSFTNLVGSETPGGLSSSGGKSEESGKFKAELKTSTDAGTREVVYGVGDYDLADGASGNAFKAANYTIGTVAGKSQAGVAGKEIISKRTITPTLTTVSRAYDGTKTLTYSAVTWTNTLSGETPKATANSFTATLTTKDAGNSKAVTYGGGVLEDNNAFKEANYQIGTVGGKSAAGVAGKEIITKRPLTATLQTKSKVYNASALFDYTVSWSGMAGDEKPGAGTGKFRARTSDGNTDAKTHNVSYDNPSGSPYGYALSDDAGGSGFKASNYSIGTITGNAQETINKRPLTATLTASNKTYDGTTTLGYTSLSYQNKVSGETPGKTGDFAVTAADKNAGSQRVGVAYDGDMSDFALANNAAGAGFKASNYTFTGVTATNSHVTIAKRTVNVSIATDDKVYDGTKALTYTPTFSAASGNTGLVSGETPGMGSGSFAVSIADADAEVNKTVTYTKGSYGFTNNTNTGFLARNYEIGTVTGDKMTIRKKTLKVSLTTNSRAYNASKVLGYQTPTITGLVNGESLSTSTGTFKAELASKDVTYNSDGDTVVAQGVTYGVGDWWSKLGNTHSSGFKKANYQMTNADVTGVGSTGNAGKEIITPKALNVALKTTDKFYDGKTDLTLTGSPTITGMMSGETPGTGSGGFTATAASKDAGTQDVTYANKDYVLADGASGNAFKAGNYRIATISGAGKAGTAGKEVIKRRIVDVAVTPKSKVYDGTKTLDYTIAEIGNVVAGETAASTGRLDVKLDSSENVNVGTGKYTALGWGTLALADGADGKFKASNYRLITSNTTNLNWRGRTVNITPKTLDVKLSAIDKTYDGDNVLEYTRVFTGMVGNEIPGIYGKDGTDFAVTTASADAGTHAVTYGAGDYKLSDGTKGFKANNYKIGTITGSSAKATIGKRSLSAIVSTSSRAYNGSNVLSHSITGYTGLVSGESVAKTGDFAVTTASADAGTHAVTYGNGDFALGNGAGSNAFKASNYTFTGATGATTQTITPKVLSVTIATANKTYDGTKTLSYTSTFGGLVGDEKVGSGTGSFAVSIANADAEVGKTVTYGKGTYGLTNNSAKGFKASNYSIGSVTGNTITIAKRQIAATLNSTGKVYDGNTTLARTATWRNVVAGETPGGDISKFSVTAGSADAGEQSVTYAKSSFVLQDGTGGFKKANYQFTDVQDGNDKVTITPKSLDVTLTTSGKVYNGNKTLSYTAAFAGLVGSEAPGAGTGTFKAEPASKDAGTHLVTYGGGDYKLTNNNAKGFKAGNYQIGSVSGTDKITITPKTLTATLTPQGKVYDGNTDLSYTALTWSGLVGDEKVASSGDFKVTADNKNVGTRTATVTRDTFALGNDGDSGFLAKNYSFTGVPSRTTNTVTITPKALSVSLSTENKVYDGNKTLTYATRFAGMVGDETPGAGSGKFKTDISSKDAGEHAVSYGVGGYTLSNGGNGFLANNYSIGSVTGNGKITIAKKQITATLTTNGKIYDGNTALTYGTAYTGVLGGETIGTSGAFKVTTASKDAGEHAVSYDEGTFKLADNSAGKFKASNYVFTGVSGNAKETIGKKTLTSNFAIANKVYDGSKDVEYTYTLTTGVGSETVASTGDFDVQAKSANVGTRDVDLKMGTFQLIDGANGFKASNYQISNAILGNAAHTSKNQVVIGKRTLTVKTVAEDRNYDGTTNIGYDVTIAGYAGIESGGFDTDLLTAALASPAVGTQDIIWTAPTMATTGDNGFKAANYALVTDFDMEAVIRALPVAPSGGNVQSDTAEAAPAPVAAVPVDLALNALALASADIRTGLENPENVLLSIALFGDSAVLPETTLTLTPTEPVEAVETVETVEPVETVASTDTGTLAETTSDSGSDSGTTSESDTNTETEEDEEDSENQETDSESETQSQSETTTS